MGKDWGGLSDGIMGGMQLGLRYGELNNRRKERTEQFEYEKERDAVADARYDELNTERKDDRQRKLTRQEEDHFYSDIAAQAVMFEGSPGAQAALYSSALKKGGYGQGATYIPESADGAGHYRVTMNDGSNVKVAPEKMRNAILGKMSSEGMQMVQQKLESSEYRKKVRDAVLAASKSGRQVKYETKGDDESFGIGALGQGGGAGSNKDKWKDVPYEIDPTGQGIGGYRFNERTGEKDVYTDTPKMSAMQAAQAAQEAAKKRTSLFKAESSEFGGSMSRDEYTKAKQQHLMFPEQHPDPDQVIADNQRQVRQAKEKTKQLKSVVTTAKSALEKMPPAEQQKAMAALQKRNPKAYELLIRQIDDEQRQTQTRTRSFKGMDNSNFKRQGL